MKLYIDGIECKAYAGQTILEVATANGIFIPSLCHGEGLAPSGACGICIVEVEGDKRLLRSCATAVREGMVVTTDSPKILESRKSLLELTMSAHTGDCKAPCQTACPAQTDCQGYIALIAAGKLAEAVELMKDAHPFPASVARICPHPCETECRRKLADEPINIAGLKRFAADWDLQRPDKYIPEVAPATGKSVAIVGGGPAGLTAAFFLKKAGHSVSVFEAMPKMGGLLRYGIPEYRLPKAVVDAELEVLTHMGIHFLNGTELGRDLTLIFLQSRYDAVIMATGAGVSKPIWCKGDDAEGVFGGINFLKAVASNKPPIIGQRVVVIGGSNTAMDAARTALRLGAEAIVAYRRTRDEMPAEKIEVEEAITEGVQFSYLTAPLEIISENGKVKGIKLQKMTLGEPDESGRRRPIPQEGGEEYIEADTIIAAIGQDVTLEGLSPLESFSIDKNFQTNLPRVFAIGDATGKSAYAIDAIGHGRKVAEVVNATLWNPAQSISEQLPEILVRDKKTAEDFVNTPKAQRQNGAEHFIHEGERPDFSAVQAGLTSAEANAEADRCLSCGCADYYECKLINLANKYNASPEKFPTEFHKRPKHAIDRSNFNFHRDMNKCVLCGLCVSVCDSLETTKTLSAVNRGFDTIVAAAFEQPLQNRDECTLCGNCVARCPVGALTEASPLPKHLVTREQITESTCTQCGNTCEMKFATKAGQILRCLPAEGKTLCEKGRFGFRNLGDKLLTPLVKKEDLLRRASLPEAAKAIREGLNILKAQYGAECIGIAISPRYVNEDIAAIIEYAAYIGTPHIFTLTDTTDPEKTHSNTQGLKKLGVSTESEKYLKMLQAGELKGLISFGDDLPSALAETPPQFLAIQTAYTSGMTTKPARNANVILPAPAYGEVQGYVISGNPEKIRTVNPAFLPACGFQTRQLIPLLSDGEVKN
ncbi:MAG: FAD-dependent oxidoreductase [Defluviitaleaceae bacterium]|nr:FAD-dependent oxidoreductase [Defluviitaleaceae bacterium]